MFLHWSGYEIDGSDTDFDIVLPENEELVEFVDCFLSIPVFGASEPHIYTTQKSKTLTKEELTEYLKSGERPEIDIDINCRVMDELPEEVQEKLYSISERRDPPEEAYGKVNKPCMAPVTQESHTRGSLTVMLSIQPSGTKSSWYKEINEDKLEGYVNNPQLMCSTQADCPCFSINVGPSFYYEYAIYIIDYLRDHFPGLATVGGLDCAGGWTEGCTYADSVYRYEKIHIPVKHSVNNILKRLCEYDIFRSYKSYYHKGWQYETKGDFYKLNFSGMDECILSFPEYVNHVENVLGKTDDVFECIHDTAVKILLPFPSRFNKAPGVEEQLTEKVKNLYAPDNQGSYCGYMAFATIDGSTVCEFRIPWKLKDYFMALLELKYSGQIEYIKTETYQRRHDKGKGGK